MQNEMEGAVMFKNILEKNWLPLEALGCMITVSIIPILNAGYDDPSIYYAVIILGSILIYKVIKQKNNTFLLSYNNSETYLVLFIVWGALSFLWSVSKTGTIIESIQILCFALIFHFIRNMDNDTQFRVVRIAEITGTFISLLGIFQYLFIQPSRIFGTFPWPNPFGIYIAMLFIMLWSYNINVMSKKIYWIMSVIYLTTLFLSGSRGSMLCTLISLPLIFIYSKKDKIKKRLIDTSICIALSAVSIVFLMEIVPYTQKIGTGLRGLLGSLIRKGDFASSAVGGRLEFWKVALKLWVKKPVSGYGLGSYYTAYYTQYVNNGWYSRFAHNHYLQVGSELGIIGLILFLCFFIFCLFSILKRFKNKNYPPYLPGVFASCLAFVLHIGIDFSWNYPGATIIFFMLLGIAVGKETPTKSESKKIKIIYPIKIIAALLILLITIWQMSSKMIFNNAYKLSISSNNDKSQANKIYTIGCSIYPFSALSYYMEGLNYKLSFLDNKNTDDLNMAEKLIVKAEKLEPFDWRYPNELGTINELKGGSKTAENYYKHALLYANYREVPYYNLGIMYYKQNRIEDAKSIFEKGLINEKYSFTGIIDKTTTAGNLAVMHYYLAMIYKSEGNSGLAQKHLDVVNDYLKQYPSIQTIFNK
jgi:Lipid A core - O-antigen ligase and related enzymes